MESKIYTQADIKKFITEQGRRDKIRDRISYVKVICVALDLPFSETKDNIFFGEVVYTILEDFYINREQFHKGKLELVSFYEAIELIGRAVYGNFSTRGDRDTRRANNWRSFIKIIPVQMYYEGHFWFSKNDVMRFADSILSTSEVHSSIVEQYNRKVCFDWLRKVLKKEYSDHVIAFLGLETCYYKRILEELARRFNTNLEGFINASRVCELLDISRTLVFKLTKKDFFPGTLTEGGIHSYPVAEVQKWIQFQKENHDMRKSIAELMKQNGINIKKPYSGNRTFNKLINFVLHKRDVGEIEITDGDKTPFPVEYFINESKYSKLEMLCQEFLERKALLVDEDHSGKFKISVEEIHNPNAPITMKLFKDFAIRRLKSLKRPSSPPFVSIYEYLSSITKELYEHNDEEIEILLKSLKSNVSNQQYIFDFCMFLIYIQKNYNAKFICNYKYDKHEAVRTKRDTSAYSEEQYFRFGFLLINDTHEWCEEYLEKALSRWASASAWLFCLLHYVCAWRRTDMMERLPRPTLSISPENFIDLIREKRFTEDMAEKIVTEVEMKVSYLRKKPSKTEKDDPPDLFFEIPESIKYRLGMLLGLCEAHRQIADGKNVLVSKSNRRDIQVNFFGLEFVDVFGGKAFCNSKATRSFTTLMAKKADEDQLGTGYIIASISRSHKCTPNQKSNTTAIYLQNYRTLTKSDIIMRELFERRVCSFVPYLVLKTVEGQDKIEAMTLSQQTKAMNELISYHPYDVEMLLVVAEEVLEKAKVEAMSLIESFGSNKATIYKFLNRIACGTAPAKEQNMNCISVAKELGCIYPRRKTCIGCGNEIYLKSSLFVIGQRMRELVSKEKSSKTTAEKIKYDLMIDKLFKPALIEIMMVLKDIYGVEDVSEYQEIVFGIGKTASGVK